MACAGLAPVPLPRGLEVVDLDRHPALAADPDRLVHRLEEVVGLGAHVGDVDPVIRRHRLGHLDQLLGGGVVARRIDQRGGEPEGAVLHRRRA